MKLRTYCLACKEHRQIKWLETNQDVVNVCLINQDS